MDINTYFKSLGRSSHFLVFLSLALMVPIAIYSALSLQALHADGSYYFINLLKAEGFTWRWEIPRTASHILQQWLAVLAVKLGEHDTQTLIRLYGLPMVLTPILFIGLSYFVLPHDQKDLFVFPVFFYLAGLMASSFSPIGEAQLASAYFWLIFFAVLFVRHRGPAIVIVPLMILPIFFFHESYVLMAPALVLAALYRYWRSTRRDESRFFLILIGMLLSVVAITLLFILIPKSGEYAARSASYLETIRSLAFLASYGQYNPPAMLGILAGAVMLLGGLSGIQSSSTAQRILLSAMALAALSAVLAPLISDGALSAKLQFDARSYGPILIPIMVVVLVLGSIRRESNRRYLLSPFIAHVLLILALGQFGWHLIATSEWRSYIRDFQAVLEGNRGLVSYDRALEMLPPHAQRRFENMSWVWTVPTMSILLARNGKVSAIIANPIRGDGSWQPFEPDRMGSDLLENSRFGFSGYQSALEKSGVPD
jgi:hypothetical protein